MATAQNLIDQAFRLLGVFAAGQTPDTTARDDALIWLNRILETWRIDRYLVFVVERKTFTLTASQASHTIGSGGNLNVTRPIKIANAGLIVAAGTNELLLHIATLEEWQRIEDKAKTAAQPSDLYYEADNTTARGKIFLWPIQDNAATLVLYLWQQLDSALVLATTLAYPPGYELALLYDLAWALIPEWGVSSAEMKAAIRDGRIEYKAAIQSVNIPLQRMRVDDALVGPGTFDLLSGGWR